jgi:lysophospholipase L1-like esterase
MNFMKRHLKFVALAALAFCLLSLHPATQAQRGSGGEHWVGTWTTAQVGRPQNPPPPPPPGPIAAPVPGQPAIPAPPPQPAIPLPFMHFNNQTLRQIVHVGIGGNRARIALSNTFGTMPVTIAAAELTLRDKEAAIVPQSARVLNFSGRPTISIPAGAMVYSDPVDLNVPPLGDLAIDLYLPGDTNTPSPLTMHVGALQTSYVSQTGNHVGETSLPVVATTQSWFLLSRVEVMAPESVGAIVTFGDSITEGARSTPDTNSRWPDVLAKRLMAQPGSVKPAVLNAGIGGNRVLTDALYNSGVDALARFERDAVDQAGVAYVIVLEAINDIGNARQNPTPTAEDLIAGHKQLIEVAHTKGLRIYGATVTPFEAANYFTKEGEAKREALNQWIRTSKAYDGVIDFDLATRDPANPTRLLPLYDSGDHLHPNDAGYKAMGDAIDLTLFKAASAPARSMGQ